VRVALNLRRKAERWLRFSLARSATFAESPIEDEDRDCGLDLIIYRSTRKFDLLVWHDRRNDRSAFTCLLCFLSFFFFFLFFNGSSR